MPVRWLICPVVTETVGGRTFRRPKVDGIKDAGQPTKDLAYLACISDGTPGQINDWCLVQVLGADLSNLSADTTLIDYLETDYPKSARLTKLQETGRGNGWNQQKFNRIRNKLVAKGIDATGLTLDSPLTEWLLRIGRAINPNFNPVFEFTSGNLYSPDGLTVIGELD